MLQPKQPSTCNCLACKTQRKKNQTQKIRPTKLTWSSLRRRNRNSFHGRAPTHLWTSHWCLQAPTLPSPTTTLDQHPHLRSMLTLRPPPNPMTVRRSNPEVERHYYCCFQDSQVEGGLTPGLCTKVGNEECKLVDPANPKGSWNPCWAKLGTPGSNLSAGRHWTAQACRIFMAAWYHSFGPAPDVRPYIW